MVLAAIKENGEIIVPIPSKNDMIDENDRVFYDLALSADAFLITGNYKHYPKEPHILTPTEFTEMHKSLFHPT